MGVTEDGEKQTLGFAQMDTENALAVSGLLSRLVERGLRYEDGILCVIDGSKGFRKAVENVFGEYAQIQRCTWHKRENILWQLSRKEVRDEIRDRLNTIYNLDTYEEAKQEMESLCEDLERENAAANSVREGLEETLTLQRLGVSKELRQSLSTTNISESLNSSLRTHLGKIKRWVDSYQCHRWVATALLECESKFQPIHNAHELPKLQKILREHVEKQILKSTSNRF